MPLSKHFNLCLVLVQPRKTSFRHDWNIVHWPVKHQHNQTNKNEEGLLWEIIIIDNEAAMIVLDTLT